MSQVCVLWHATEVKGLFIRSMQHEHGDKKVEEGEKRPKIAKWYLLFRSLPVVASMLQPEHELEVVIFLSVLCPDIASSRPNNGYALAARSDFGEMGLAAMPTQLPVSEFWHINLPRAGGTFTPS